MNREPFAPGEWYHCYTRGVDKRKTFEHKGDYQRFLESLYLCNTPEPAHRSNLTRSKGNNAFVVPKAQQLVSVGAYCLMPNHFHLLVQEPEHSNGKGISRFMQKLGTSFTSYFNISRDRIGNLFVKPFRSKHVGKDDYFNYVAQYIHLNPIELFEPGWKDGSVKDLVKLEEQIRAYPYSSFQEYLGEERLESSILDKDAVKLLSVERPPLSEVLLSMADYYESLKVSNYKVTPR